MTMLPDAPRPLAGPPAPLSGECDSSRKRRIGDKGDLKGAIDQWERTEFQVRPHAGFKPEAIKRRDLDFVPEDASRTMLLAQPPGWTETKKPCDFGEWDQPDDWAKTWDPHTWNLPRAKADAKAATLCSRCPVRTECLEDAMSEEGTLGSGSRFLVRGGLTPKGRTKLARQRTEQPV